MPPPDIRAELLEHRGRKFLFAAGVLPAVSSCVGRDAEQPRCEGNAAPLVPWQVAQGLVEDLGSDVLGFLPGADPPRHERVHAVEVLVVQLGEAAGVLLRRFDQ